MSKDTSGTIIAPIGLAELYSEMGLAPKDGCYDLVYLCGNQHGKINKWADCKPIRGGTQAPITDTQRWTEQQVSDLGDRVATVSINGLLFAKATSLGYGNGTGTFIVTKGFLYKLINGQLPKPDYLAPRAGTDVSRIIDFEGYRHQSPPLFPRFPGGTQRVRYVGSGTLVPFQQGQEYAHWARYFSTPTKRLCAVAWFYSEDTHMNVMSVGTYMNRLGQEGILFKSFPAKNVELNIRLFVSSLELYQGNFGSDAWGAAGTFYSADELVSKVNVYSSGRQQDIELWQCMYNNTATQIRFAFRIYENAPSGGQMVQPRLYFYNSSAAADIGMGWQKLKDITPHVVPGESYLDFILTVATPAFKGGEKLRFVSYFAEGNTVDLTAAVEAYDYVKWNQQIEGMDTLGAVTG